jgi:hypothetical protein
MRRGGEHFPKTRCFGAALVLEMESVNILKANGIALIVG